MQAAAEDSDGGMVALIGADEAAARELCDEAAGGEILVCANFNAPGQIVLSGNAGACRRALSAAEGRGFKAQALAVAGAFHCPIMQPAADGMAEALKKVSLKPPGIPVWSNVTARPHDGANLELLRQRLVKQIVSPVRWSETCRGLGGSDTMEYHELAPGTVLRGLMRRIDRTKRVNSHDQPD